MSTFNYNVDIPDGPHNPSSDQPLMKTNTNSTKSIIGVDHYTFQEATKDGWHKQSTYLSTTPTPVTASTQLALFAKGGTPNQGAILAMIRDNIPQTLVALTTAKIAAPLAIGTGNGGCSWLPGEILVQWGIYNASGGNFSSGSTTQSSSGESVVTFPAAFPNNVFFFGGNLTYSQGNLPSGTGTLNTRLSQLNTGSLRTTMDWQVYTDTNNYIGFVWYAIGN